ncbi:MAG: ABC transporter ATP-binding protein [Burkholderiales bacterium]|nr:ABC transporter ATP-binding protein [Burkholderiales bacterium]
MSAKIRVAGLTKSFARNGDTLRVVDGIDFSVDDGEFVALVGPSGCGKTTILHIMAGFMPPDSGQVVIDGAPVSEASPNRILISQQGSVFPWLTVRRNLMFGLRDHPARAAELADHYAGVVGLAGFEQSYPHELSGGMLRRVEMARALVVKPEILFMDEPLAALDALTSLQIRFELQRILDKERHTCVLITHDVEEAIHLADRILVLSKRPARIQATFDVELQRPRDLASPEVARLKAAILGELGL